WNKCLILFKKPTYWGFGSRVCLLPHRFRVPVLAEAGGAGEYQRFDHHRDRTGTFHHRADIDEVEVFQFQTVDRDHRAWVFHFLAQMNAEKAAHVAVAGEHHRMAVLQHRIETLHHAFAEGIETLARSRAAPWHEDRDGGFAP